MLTINHGELSKILCRNLYVMRKSFMRERPKISAVCDVMYLCCFLFRAFIKIYLNAGIFSRAAAWNAALHTDIRTHTLARVHVAVTNFLNLARLFDINYPRVSNRDICKHTLCMQVE
jgi:hypothetical protein